MSTGTILPVTKNLIIPSTFLLFATHVNFYFQTHIIHVLQYLAPATFYRALTSYSLYCTSHTHPWIYMSSTCVLYGLSFRPHPRNISSSFCNSSSASLFDRPPFLGSSSRGKPGGLALSTLLLLSPLLLLFVFFLLLLLLPL